MNLIGSSGNSELIVLCKVHTGFDEDSFHCFPIVVMISSGHAMNFPLTSNGMAILLPRNWKEHLSSCVLEAHCILPLPVCPTALHNPYIEVISFTIITKGTYFLLETQISWSENMSKRCQCTHKNISHKARKLKGKDAEERNITLLSTALRFRSSNSLQLQLEHKLPTNSNT